jgi:hypothetical protein
MRPSPLIFRPSARPHSFTRLVPAQLRAAGPCRGCGERASRHAAPRRLRLLRWVLLVALFVSGVRALGLQQGLCPPLREPRPRPVRCPGLRAQLLAAAAVQVHLRNV